MVLVLDLVLDLSPLSLIRTFTHAVHQKSGLNAKLLSVRPGSSAAIFPPVCVHTSHLHVSIPPELYS